MEIIVKRPEIIVKKNSKKRNKKILFFSLNLVLILLFTIGRILDYTTTKYGLEVLGLRDYFPVEAALALNYPIFYFSIICILCPLLLLFTTLFLIKKDYILYKIIPLFLILAIISLIPVFWNFYVLSQHIIESMPISYFPR